MSPELLPIVNQLFSPDNAIVGYVTGYSDLLGEEEDNKYFALCFENQYIAAEYLDTAAALWESRGVPYDTGEDFRVVAWEELWDLAKQQDFSGIYFIDYDYVDQCYVKLEYTLD